MKWRLPSFPVLARDLVEQANRKWTFRLRTLYAVLLYGIVLFFLHDEIYRRGRGLDVLGEGEELFEIIVALQFTGIYLFMPAMLAGAIANEKERDTLGILLLTRLGPWTIVVEKLLARVIPMLELIFLSLPLLTVAYALGGVETSWVFLAAGLFVLTLLQVATLSLACSAFFRTTGAAYVATYVLGLAFYFTPAVASELLLSGAMAREWSREMADSLAGAFGAFGYAVNIHSHQIWFLHTPAGLVDTNASDVVPLVVLSLPMALSVVVFLLLARVFLVQRAFVGRKNPFLIVFRKLDKFFRAVNENRVTRGRVLIDDDVALPLYEPIVWQETKKKTLGTLRYLIRVLLVIEVPVLFICLATLPVAMQNSYPSEVTAFTAWGAWILAALVLIMKSTGLFAGERAARTLEVLLTTPLSTQQMLDEKRAGIRRLFWVMAVPILTCVVFNTYARAEVGGLRSGARFEPFIYFAASAVALVTALPLVIELGIIAGMRAKSQTRALFTTLAVVTVWSALPLASLIVMIELFYRGGPYLATGIERIGIPIAMVTGPASVIMFNEVAEIERLKASAYVGLLLTLLSFRLIIFLLRRWSLKSADAWLNRLSEPERIPRRVVESEPARVTKEPAPDFAEVSP